MSEPVVNVSVPCSHPNLQAIIALLHVTAATPSAHAVDPTLTSAPAETVEPPAEVKRRRGRPSKAEVAARGEKAAAPTEAPETVTLDSLREVLQKAIEVAGRPAVKNVFAEMGVARLTELKPDTYSTMHDALSALAIEF